MTLSIDYRTDGPWGAGLGRKLENSEVDENFYSIQTAVTDLQNDRPQPNNIASITVDQTRLVFTFADGSTMTVPAPVLTFRYRGEWAPEQVYNALDVFIVTGTGEFSVLIDHTSADTFDPNATDGSGSPLYLLMLPMQSGGGALSELSDVSLGTLNNGDILTYDTATGLWHNAPFPALNVEDLADVLISGTLSQGQVLGWDTASSKWVNGGVNLSGLGDVHLTGLADQQLLVWHASAAQWVNANPPAGTGGVGTSALNPRGDWSSSNVYAPNDVVRSDPAFFVCYVGVGRTSVPPATDTAHWAQVSIIDSRGFDAAFSNAPGSILQRDASGWDALAPGPAGTFPKSQGAGLPLVYSAPDLSTLGDVDATGLADKFSLRWDAASSTWKTVGDGKFTEVTVNGTASGAGLVNLGGVGCPPTTAAGWFGGVRTNGAVGAPTPVLSGDDLAAFAGGGWDGSDYNTDASGPGPASFLIQATENWSTTAHGTRLVFATVKNGTTAVIQTIAVENDGGIIAPFGVTGGSQGPGSINVGGGFYINGVPVVTIDSVHEDLDAIGSTPGDMLYRGSIGWAPVPPGNDGDQLVYDATNHKPAWQRPRYLIGISAPQTTAYTASQVLGHHKVAAGVTIPADFAAYQGLTSRAGGSVNATASTIIGVEVAPAANPNSFSRYGTITIAAGGVGATLSSSGVAIVLNAGDVLRFIAPATPDTTFAGFYATLVGYET